MNYDKNEYNILYSFEEEMITRVYTIIFLLLIICMIKEFLKIQKLQTELENVRNQNQELTIYFDEAREITETLLGGRTVILNLEGLDLEIAQRIIDFTSGATFAINGNLQKISTYIFLVTPTNVDISGDLQDLLNSSFDVPSIKSRY